MASSFNLKPPQWDEILFEGAFLFSFIRIFTRYLWELKKYLNKTKVLLQSSERIWSHCDPLSIPILIFYLFSFSFSGWTLGEGIVVHDQNDDNVDVEKMTVVEGMIKSDLTGGSTAQAHKNWFKHIGQNVSPNFFCVLCPFDDGTQCCWKKYGYRSPF